MLRVRHGATVSNGATVCGALAPPHRGAEMAQAKIRTVFMHRSKLVALGILDAAVLELIAWRVENFTAENCAELHAALILVVLLPNSMAPALVNSVVADILKVINACARMQVQAEHTHVALGLAFQALWFLFGVSLSPARNDAALVAYNAGMLTPAFRAAAERSRTSVMADQVVQRLELAHQLAVEAADAAMAELLAEEESEAAA